MSKKSSDLDFKPRKEHRKSSVPLVGKRKSKKDFSTEVAYDIAETRTKNILRIAYQCGRIRTSSASFTKMVDLCELVEGNVGEKLRSGWTYSKILLMFGCHLHKKVEHEVLNEKNRAISIILDESTDRSSRKYLIVYFLIAGNQERNTIFYQIIQLKDATASSIYLTLKNSFKTDKILDILREKLVGFGSDGAAVMLGVNNGLLKVMKRDGFEKLHEVHCFAKSIPKKF